MSEPPPDENSVPGKGVPDVAGARDICGNDRLPVRLERVAESGRFPHAVCRIGVVKSSNRPRADSSATSRRAVRRKRQTGPNSWRFMVSWRSPNVGNLAGPALRVTSSVRQRPAADEADALRDFGHRIVPVVLVLDADVADEVLPLQLGEHAGHVRAA